MNEEQRIEDVLATVEREVGPVGLIARIQITRAIEAAIHGDDDHEGPHWDDDDEPDDPDEPEPDPPLPPDPGPGERPDLHVMFGLDVLGKDFEHATQPDMLDEVPT